MKRSELGLVPLTYPMPTGRPPAVNRLALFGAPSPAIGTVVCATSTIDTAGGWVPDGSGGIAPETPPAGIKWWHVLIALFPIAPFAGIAGGFLGHALSPSPVGEQASFDLTWPGALVFAALAIALTLRKASQPNLPMSVGQAIVVGTEGFEECTYSEFVGGGPSRSVVRYDDPERTWALKASGVALGNRVGRVKEELTIADAKTGEKCVTLTWSSGTPERHANAFDQETDAACARIMESATRVKVARAEAARHAGQPVVFPVVEGKARRLVLTPAALEDHHGGQVRTLPLSRLRTTVAKGVYNFSADDGSPPILLERHRIGDVFVLEALLGLRD